MSGLLKAANIAAKIMRGVLVERILTLLTRTLIDAPMIGLFFMGFSILEVMAIFILWCFIFYIVVIYIYDYFVEKRGYDFLGLDYLSNLQNQEIPQKRIFKRLARWIVRRKITIFLLGSLFELDPDVVAILLRRKGEKGVKVLLWSVIYSISIYSIIYWLGVKGYRFFAYFIQ